MEHQREHWAIRAGSAWLRFCVGFGVATMVLLGPLILAGIIVFFL